MNRTVFIAEDDADILELYNELFKLANVELDED